MILFEHAKLLHLFVERFSARRDGFVTCMTCPCPAVSDQRKAKLPVASGFCSLQFCEDAALIAQTSPMTERHPGLCILLALIFIVLLAQQGTNRGVQVMTRCQQEEGTRRGRGGLSGNHVADRPSRGERSRISLH